MKFVLNEYHRNVPDEEYIHDMQSVAQALGANSLTSKEYNANGKYSVSGIAKHFGSWRIACEKAGFILTNKQSNPHSDISEDDIITDMKRVAALSDSLKLTKDKYDLLGFYHSSTVLRCFGSWNQALQKAGLPITLNRNFTNVELFKDIENMWSTLGRQPTTTDLKRGIGQYSLNAYRRRFGGWREALSAFVEYINNEEEIETPIETRNLLNDENPIPTFKHKTVRDINLRLRFLVFSRDNFSCCSCGASPAKDGGITRLHVDHIVPWSKGGETVLENLQTLCEKCNLGKSNIEL